MISFEFSLMSYSLNSSDLVMASKTNPTFVASFSCKFKSIPETVLDVPVLLI